MGIRNFLVCSARKLHSETQQLPGEILSFPVWVANSPGLRNSINNQSLSASIFILPLSKRKEKKPVAERFTCEGTSGSIQSNPLLARKFPVLQVTSVDSWLSPCLSEKSLALSVFTLPLYPHQSIPCHWSRALKSKITYLCGNGVCSKRNRVAACSVFVRGRRKYIVVLTADNCVVVWKYSRLN